MHVLILGARAPACLEWARAFAASGWKVTVADSLRSPVTRYSRAVNHYLHLPEPRSNPDAWINALRDAVQTRAIDLVLPTCEEAFYLGYGLEHIPCRVATMPLEALQPLHHKYQFAQMTQAWEVTAPESHLLESAADAAAFAETASAWVFKPAYSRFANRTLIRPGRKPLLEIQPTAQQPWVAQRCVSGREHCSYSLLVDGRLTAHACYHPRYRVGRGSGIWFEPTDPPAIRAFVEHFGMATGYNGQVAFDFIEADDGRCYVLECNPRATSGVHLFDDQPEGLVQALLGRNDTVLTPTSTPRMIALAMLLFALPRHGLRRAFWQDFAAARDTIVRNGDWLPLVAQIPALLEILWRVVSRRRGLLAATTADIEWDGQPMQEPSCN
jgi:glutathione synthase/RimK-type ligase-like ATP-grasp enzyme